MQHNPVCRRRRALRIGFRFTRRRNGSMLQGGIEEGHPAPSVRELSKACRAGFAQKNLRFRFQTAERTPTEFLSIGARSTPTQFRSGCGPRRVL
jgi:hypothetical protein